MNQKRKLRKDSKDLGAHMKNYTTDKKKRRGNSRMDSKVKPKRNFKK